MSDHLDGTQHRFEFVQLVNQLYDGTALASADAMVMCRRCGAWQIVPQERMSLTGGLRP